MNFLSTLSSSSKNLVPKMDLSKIFTNGHSDVAFHEVENGITRNQVIYKIVSAVIGAGASFAVTYFVIKWLTDAMDPTKKEKRQAHIAAQKMLERLGIKNVGNLSDYELCIAANLLDPHSIEITWAHIGGLENVIDDIHESVILPFTRADLFKNSRLIQPPKGILLYGPPGCGKTMIAKATAKAAGARFINLQVSTLVDKWYGESQKRAEAVFSLATKLQPAIIFIDEIDSFLRSRSSSDHEATAMMKTQFMSLWDGMTSDPDCHVMVMGATNRRLDVDAAILRRMPSQYYIGMPDADQRKSILKLILRREKMAEDMNFDQLSQLSEGLSGSDLHEVCRLAAVSVLSEHVQNNPERESDESNDSLRGLKMSDLQGGIYKIKQSKNIQQHPPMD